MSIEATSFVTPLPDYVHRDSLITEQSIPGFWELEHGCMLISVPRLRLRPATGNSEALSLSFISFKLNSVVFSQKSTSSLDGTTIPVRALLHVRARVQVTEVFFDLGSGALRTPLYSGSVATCVPVRYRLEAWPGSRTARARLCNSHIFSLSSLGCRLCEAGSQGLLAAAHIAEKTPPPPSNAHSLVPKQTNPSIHWPRFDSYSYAGFAQT